MKKLILCLCLVAFASVCPAQLKGILDRAKQKAANKASEKVDKTIDKPTDPTSGKTENKEKTADNNNGADTTKKETAQPASLKTYSKYDFVPGEKIIVFEDFAQDAVGDFPAKWVTNASGEVVTIDGNPGHWFMMHRAGTFMPEFIDSLQDNFPFAFKCH